MTNATVEPLREAGELAAYIDRYWAADHVLARNPAMLEFTYATPWVDRELFPAGLSVLGAYAPDDRLVGFLGAIVAPYPRPHSYWLALWHVLPELKGSGMGGRLLRTLQDLAIRNDGWIGTFGAGPEALPVYLRRGYVARAVRRWIFDPEAAAVSPAGGSFNPAVNITELPPDREWTDFRFRRHPLLSYDLRPTGVFRTETNAWGRVTHAVRLAEESDLNVAEVHRIERAAAEADGRPYMMDAWSFTRPGDGWVPAAEDLPSVFHPPEARGALVYAVGFPFLPRRVQKGDCDQDRPN